MLLIAWGGDREAVSRWRQPLRKNSLWPLLAMWIALAPTLPMQFPDTWRFLLRTDSLVMPVLAHSVWDFFLFLFRMI
jgi:hypothetical protein